MLAIIAMIVFIIAFVLDLVGADTGKISLLFLGLALLAAHLAFGAWTPWVRRP